MKTRNKFLIIQIILIGLSLVLLTMTYFINLEGDEKYLSYISLGLIIFNTTVNIPGTIWAYQKMKR